MKLSFSVSPGPRTSSVFLSSRPPQSLILFKPGLSSGKEALGPNIRRKITNETTHNVPFIYINYFCFNLLDAQKPEIVEGPKNQSVLIGSNASLSCTARGLPRPTIHWIKDNASYPLQSNPRVRVIPDGRANRSQLLITRVEMEDYGKYQCIANSSIGRSQSGVAVLKKGEMFFINGKEKKNRVRGVILNYKRCTVCYYIFFIIYP